MRIKLGNDKLKAVCNIKFIMPMSWELRDKLEDYFKQIGYVGLSTYKYFVRVTKGKERLYTDNFNEYCEWEEKEIGMQELLQV